MNTLTRKKKLHKQLFLIQIIFSILKKECDVHNFFYYTFTTNHKWQVVTGCYCGPKSNLSGSFN